MNTRTLPAGASVHGGTALGARSGDPRHLLGSALRALRVFAEAAFRVVVLGPDGKRF